VSFATGILLAMVPFGFDYLVNKKYGNIDLFTFTGNIFRDIFFMEYLEDIIHMAFVLFVFGASLPYFFM
jgi:hypothetical protein